MRKLLLLSTGIAACLASPVLAQTSDDEKYVGIGVRVRPAYEGADSSRGETIPYFRLYGEHLFARTTQGMLEGEWRLRPYGAWVFGQLTWANSKSTQNYFGITPQQSAVTGLPAYNAGSGLRYLQLGLLGSVNPSDHWLIPWGASMQLLQGDAGDSPIVQDRSNWYLNAGIAYRF